MTKRTVHIVDDDAAVRRSLSFMLKTSGFHAVDWASGPAILKSLPVEAGVLLLDMMMPDMDGLAVQRALDAAGTTLPVIVITGHGDIAMAVKAMRAGAFDFIEKPFEKTVLLRAVEAAFAKLDQAGRVALTADEAVRLLNVLTPRERDVFDGLALGRSNKAIAAAMGISPRTVEIHRAHVMTKLDVPSLAQALRIAFAAEASETV